MTMQPELWSINALSTELGIDRRTLSKKLATLPATQSKKAKGRIEKRWRLIDVVKHLNRLDHPPSRSEEMSAINGYRMLHIFAISHFVEWSFEQAWEEWRAEYAESELDESIAAAIYKHAYLVMIGMMVRYLSEDVFEKHLQSQTGAGMDTMHALIAGESKPSKPIKAHEIPYEVPKVVRGMLSENEREALGIGSYI